MKLEYLLHVEG